MKVLIIDDSRSLRALLRTMLGECAERIVEAENGQEGLAVLEANPDTELALVDWNMPVMNGLEFVTAVRSNPAFRSMKIVMVTTETGMNEVVRAMTAGADEYVMKPFNVDVIQEKVRILGL